MHQPLSPHSIVILTGAGISAESGLGTFRDKDGIWTKHPIEDLATPEGFARNPDFVHGFYNDRRAQLRTAKANAAHTALAELEAAFRQVGKHALIVTQNVDNLHTQAGSKNILHMHGELTKIRCGACNAVTYWPDDIGQDTICPTCETQGLMRPHVVWFGEMPLYMDEIYKQISNADLFVSIGTSGNVYPAAGFVQDAIRGGADTLELNLEPSDGATLFKSARYGKASKIVPEWVSAVLESI